MEKTEWGKEVWGRGHMTVLNWWMRAASLMISCLSKDLKEIQK